MQTWVAGGLFASYRTDTSSWGRQISFHFEKEIFPHGPPVKPSARGHLLVTAQLVVKLPAIASEHGIGVQPPGLGFFQPSDAGFPAAHRSRRLVAAGE
jgi:hypothetical protein